MTTDRRAFLGLLLAGAGSLRTTSALPYFSSPPATPHLACNQYVWHTFYQREGRSYADALDRALGEMAEAGLDGLEPSVTSPEEIAVLAPLLRTHGLAMRSLYVNSTLHEPDQAEQSIAQVVAIAEAAGPLGTRLIVTNPSPIRWGGPESKTDAQLAAQAEALDRLGARLRAQEQTLSYHNHDIELRHAAREFHHMLLATDPAHVTFCLDVHWVYRGSGNSQIALFDVIDLYGDRVTELHLRQSKDGAWTETFGAGDIDYPRVAEALQAAGAAPHLVLEQAVEEGTPHTMDAVAAHRQNVAYARDVFAAFGS